MPRNIRLLISFDGTNYKGWQRQSNAATIQGTVEEKLAIICGEKINIHGAGRTDTGVHALGMVANFHTNVAHAITAFSRGLNSFLPEDIRVLAAEDVPKEFHSRFCATGKKYRYDFYTGKNILPTERLYTTHIPAPLDIDLIQICLNDLVGTHDFASFTAAGSKATGTKSKRGTVRTISKALCRPIANRKNSFSLIFIGDGFLRHMIRNLTGTIWMVGQGEITPSDFKNIFIAKDRNAAGPTAPPCGLFLERVYYENLIKTEK
jgi:tRNA pseudouridine38-40 synthase